MPFEKGNTYGKGRPKRPEIELVRRAIAATEREVKKSLWKHLIEQCYKDNNVLIAVAKKFMPDKIVEDTQRQILVEFERKVQEENAKIEAQKQESEGTQNLKVV